MAWTIAMDELHHDGDYSPWEGWKVTGRPVMTVLLGRVVVEGGRLLGSPADGRFVTRRVDPRLLSRPFI